MRELLKEILEKYPTARATTQFGMNSISSQPMKVEVGGSSCMTLDEVIKANKPLTPQQARIKSLQTQKDNVNKQLKSERDKQKIQKAQQQIQSVRNQKNTRAVF